MIYLLNSVKKSKFVFTPQLQKKSVQFILNYIFAIQRPTTCFQIHEVN